MGLFSKVCADHLNANFLSPERSCPPAAGEGTEKTFTKGNARPTFRQIVGGKSSFFIRCSLIAFGSK